MEKYRKDFEEKVSEYKHKMSVYNEWSNPDNNIQKSNHIVCNLAEQCFQETLMNEGFEYLFGYSDPLVYRVRSLECHSIDDCKNMDFISAFYTSKPLYQTIHKIEVHVEYNVYVGPESICTQTFEKDEEVIETDPATGEQLTDPVSGEPLVRIEKFTRKCEDYRGKQNVARDGTECQSWQEVKNILL